MLLADDDERFRSVLAKALTSRGLTVHQAASGSAAVAQAKAHCFDFAAVDLRMPGAGGLLAANYLYASAPQDGTTIGIINSTVPLAPLWGTKGARL